MVKGTDSKGSCKLNYHTTTTAPYYTYIMFREKKSNSKQFSRILYLFYHTNCGLSKFMIVCIYKSCLPFFGGLESSYNCILMYLKFVLNGKLKNMHVFNAK